MMVNCRLWSAVHHRAGAIIGETKKLKNCLKICISTLCNLHFAGAIRFAGKSAFITLNLFTSYKIRMTKNFRFFKQFSSKLANILPKVFRNAND